MTKNIKATLGFIFFFLFFINLQAQRLLRPDDHFKGEVVKVYESKKEVFKRTEIWKFDKQDFRSGEIATFGNHGQYKTKAVYIFPDDPYFTTKFKSDTNGEYKSAEVHIRSGLASNLVYYRNASGLIDSVVHISTHDNKRFRVISYEYKNEKVSVFRQEEIGRSTSKYTYQWIKDNIEQEIRYNESDNIISIKKYEYNDKGFPKLIRTYDADNKLKNREHFSYKYDKEGNWVKRLSTDIKKDLRTLVERDIIYKNTSSKNITKKELIGIWSDWSGKISLEVKSNLAKITNQKQRFGGDAEGSYTYSPSTGILSITSNSKYQEGQDYHTSYDGQVLTLENHKSGKIFHLRKTDISLLSAHDQAKYHYRSSQEKSSAKSYKENELYGLKSSTGQILFKPKYSSVYPVTNKVVKVMKDGKHGLVNYKGKLLADCKYDELTLRSLGYFRFKKDNKKGLLDPNGKEIVPAIYSNVWVDPIGFIIVEERSKRGIFTLEYKPVAPVEYNSLNESNFNRSFAYRGGYHNNDWLDSHYRVVKNFKQCLSIKPIDANCFKMKGAGGWGLIDSLGNEIMEPQYEALRRGTAQLLIAEKEDKFGLVNTAGEQITTLDYDRIFMHYVDDYNHKIDLTLKENEAAAIFLKGNTFGYLDGFGNEVAPTLSPSINRKYSYKLYEKGNDFKFYYPYSWNQMGQSFSSQDKDLKASLRYQTITYSGDPRLWILNNNQVQDFSEETINGIQVYKDIRTTKGQRHDTFELYYYFVIDESRIVRLSTLSSKFQYLKVAQEFYDMIHSFELTK